MFLTTDQLRALTGRAYAKHQIRWLAEHGYKFDIAATGKPRVLASHVEAKLGGKLTVRRTDTPDEQALRDWMHGKAQAAG